VTKAALTCPAAGLGTIEDERRQRLESRRHEGRESPAVFEAALAPWRGTPVESPVRAAYAFAGGLEYSHPGLSPAAYLAHPVRVAALALRVCKPVDVDAAVLALLHNAYEVSSIRPAAVAAAFGSPIADGIGVLTVDRAANSRAYTAGYYRAIGEAPGFVRVVKVLDKVDNLFLLGLNPEPDVRARYLDEIEEFVVPMAQRDVPALVSYLRALVTDTRKTGFLDARSL
jgi:(p)ppGpp synthase/HD superfamily hydrolase